MSKKNNKKPTYLEMILHAYASTHECLNPNEALKWIYEKYPDATISIQNVSNQLGMHTLNNKSNKRTGKPVIFYEFKIEGESSKRYGLLEWREENPIKPKIRVSEKSDDKIEILIEKPDGTKIRMSI